jgi:hypothetical protein
LASVERRLHQNWYIAGEDSHARWAAGSGRWWMMVAAIAPPQLASSTSGACPAAQGRIHADIDAETEAAPPSTMQR